MQRGYDPVIALGRDGMIAGVALGADCTSEHEWGIDDLRSKFCSGGFTTRDLENKLDASGEVPDFDLKTRDHINKNLEGIELVEEDGFVTITTYNREFARPIFHRVGKDKLHSADAHYQEEVNKAKGSLATEWSGQNFRFCNALYGDEKLMKKLRKFHEQIQAQNCAFFSVRCGLWSGREGSIASGLTIVDRTRLSYAQHNYWRVMESELRERLVLRKHSRLDVILQRFRDGELSKHGYIDAGFFWPMWEDKKTKTKVVYGLNPGYQVKADYFGPYTEGQLTRWFDHDMKYKLTRESPEKETNDEHCA